MGAVKSYSARTRAGASSDLIVNLAEIKAELMRRLAAIETVEEMLREESLALPIAARVQTAGLQ